MDIKTAESSMLSNAQIEIVVPTDGEIDLTSSPKQRPFVFLDELVDVYVLIHTTADENSLDEQLPGLSISLETLVVGFVEHPSRAQSPVTHPQPQVRDVVNVCTIDTIQDPLTAITSDGITLAWSAQVHIDRTRITSTSPSLSFTATITLNPTSAQSPKLASPDDDYLPSGIPISSLNLLAALAHSKSFANYPDSPYLAASLLAKDAPLVRPQTLQLSSRPPRSSKAVSSDFKLCPAVTSQIRIFNLGRAPNVTKVFASVELGIGQSLSHAKIDELKLLVPGGEAELCSVPGAKMSLELKEGDLLSLAYNISPNLNHHTMNNMKSGGPPKDTISVSLIAIAFSKDEPNRPRKIRTQFTMPIDSPMSSQKAAPARNNSHAPSQEQNPLHHLLTLATTRHPSSMTYASPGDSIRWTLLITNLSTSRTLNLLIIPITPWANSSAPSRQDGLGTQIAQNDATKSRTSRGKLEIGGSQTGKHERNSVRDLPIWLYASASFHPSIAMDTATLSTSNVDANSRTRSFNHDRANEDTRSSRSGPSPSAYSTLLPSPPSLHLESLPPGTSTTAELSFLVLSARGGTTCGGIEAIRLVDLDSFANDGRWRWVDVGEEGLPDVVVVGGNGAGFVTSNKQGVGDVDADAADAVQQSGEVG